MPARTTPLINGQYYHVFNRGINKQPIFKGARDYKRALDVMKFYAYSSSMRLSKFLLVSREERQLLWEEIVNKNEKLANIVCFCFMPNHFHFLVQQKADNGISKFIGNFQNSYTRYFNTKHDGIGPLLQGQFKAVLVEDDSQLLHLSRYIHLNPYSSFVLKEIDDLVAFPWSSFQEYVEERESSICDKEVILSQFIDKLDYKKFVFDQADYQRELKKIKHLALEA